ncbi:BON domain-containing protein [Planctomyces sp. SH-PL62]|uniref:BON domain-containing protein n=1 Tax=Planctomyces sp. SH-PL62 TaxID=1636152 RepID=UPI00078E762E|nr:BON domain-containing protein [Planctomyces sp. SH-PL62]AMV39766.1 hypothetical protein VT85_20200 [Planctomyces sp. SH-PL62]
MDSRIAVEVASLADQVADQIRRSTYGRIRNLRVEEDEGRVVVTGEVRTWHAKQQALQGALELLSGDRFRERITVVGPVLSGR